MIHTETLGKGPDLVLLHGWGWHSGIWSSITDELSKVYRITLIDLPGFGRSELLKGTYDLIHLAQAVRDVAPARAVWMGWSLGGMVAMRVASNAPDRVSKLITVASTPKFVSDIHWPGIPQEVFKNLSERLQNYYDATLIRFLSLQLQGQRQSRTAFRDLKEKLFQFGKPSLAALNGGLNILWDVDLRDTLKELKVPLLQVYGKKDALIPVEVASETATIAPSCITKIFEGAGHLPFISHKQPFLDTVNEFIHE